MSSAIAIGSGRRAAWRTLGAAFLLGAWLGFEPPHLPRGQLAREALVGDLARRAVQRGTADAPVVH